MKKIVLCGGGTAGHVMPNLALLPYLFKSFDKVHYIGSIGGIERQLLAPYKDVIYHEIRCAKLRRTLTLRNFEILYRLPKSISDAKKLLKSISPDVIFSKGGFAALPVILAAGKVPVIAHESDMTMGLANRIVKNKCKYICFSFETPAKKYRNGIYTGSPVRQELYSGNRQTILNECGFSGRLPVLLIMGGSLGARAINSAVSSALPTLQKSYDIIHLVGKGNERPLDTDGYRAFSFRNDMADIFAAADLVVSRGGSNALCEILALKKPALIIPLPKSESRGDQIDNAKYFSDKKQIITLPQERLTPESLTENIAALSYLKDTLMKNIDGKIDGTMNIYELILKECLR